MPLLPYGVVNYSAGLTHLPYTAMAVGTLIGAAPKVFVYTALGGSLDDLTSPEALIALVLWALLGLAGAAVSLEANRREPVAAWRTRNAPRSISASPTLNTFAPGQPSGMAKTSPRKPTCGLRTRSELANSPDAGSRPAVRGRRPTPASRRRSPRSR